MRALVLSGGGSKGAYQIGVWKALKKLHITFDIVTGTSTGAINGALITQKSYFKAIKVWKTLNYQSIFGKDFNNETKLEALYRMFVKNYFTDGGTEVKELQTLINKNLKLRKFYKSNINYGLITYNVSTKNAVSMEKKDIPKEKLGDYILASASCFPAFKKKEIDGEEYVDGGYYDNMPVNLAIDMGADEVIAVDLKAVGLKRKTKKPIKETIISPRNDLSNFLVFDPNISKKIMKYGYNDTMKTYGSLEGNKFTFKRKQLKKFNDRYIEKYKKLLLKVLNTNELMNIFTKNLLNSKFTKKIEKYALEKLIEDIGYKYKLDDTKIYTFHSFNRKLKRKVKKNLKTDHKDITLHMYKLLLKRNYTQIRKDAILKPLDLARAIYIYIVLEG